MTKILIVDDDISATALMEKILKMAGFEITAVNASTKAVQMAFTISPDLILLDIMMPDINGIDLCKTLKSFPEFKQVPIAIVSALTDIGSKRDALNAGAIGFITKPLHIKEFTANINQLLSGLN
jgi:DNA-binding response OmpR family regulator